MRKILFILTIWGGAVTSSTAQTVSTDSAKTEVRRYTARNFSEERTFNLYWETSPDRNYHLKQSGQKMERGRIRNKHTVKFSAVIPILDKSQFTLNVKGNANFYKFDVKNDMPNIPSLINKGAEKLFSYHKIEVNTSYMLNVFQRPLVLQATVSGDGWNGGFGRVDGTLTALYMLNYGERSQFYAGLCFIALYDFLPVLPIIIYSYQFTPDFYTDISLPSSAYMRWQFANSHRLSLGMLTDAEMFYCKPRSEQLPETALFKLVNLKAELDYEYIINDHFYLIARCGVTKPFESGFFKVNRKGKGVCSPLVDYSQRATSFFNIGFSYNIWK